MTFPVPRPGLVIRYAYLWRREQLQGQDEGRKDRPCAILLAVQDAEGDRTVIALPITHTPPSEPAHAVELPPATKRRLGLDDTRSWIVLTEGNRFVWPGPDLRRARPDDPGSVTYGELPAALFEQVRQKWLKLYEAKRTSVVRRTE